MNARILIKIGGRAFDGEEGFRELAQGIKETPGAEVLIVHGGGAEIFQALTAAGRETVFVDGMRVTQAEDVPIVESVLSGAINERIAGWLSKNGVCCRRMSGKTQGLLIAEPLLTRGGKSMGFVGRIVKVNAAVALDALAKKEVPVVSPISGDTQGQSYNVNADSAAAALAAAAHCSDLVFITDVPDILRQQTPFFESHPAMRSLMAPERTDSTIWTSSAWVARPSSTKTVCRPAAVRAWEISAPPCTMTTSTAGSLLYCLGPAPGSPPRRQTPARS